METRLPVGRSVCLLGQTRFSHLPVPHASNIHVHEIRGAVVANPAAMECQSGVPQLSGGRSRQPDINRHRLHVQAVLRHAVAMRPQEVVAPGSPIATHDVDLAA